MTVRFRARSKVSCGIWGASCATFSTTIEEERMCSRSRSRRTVGSTVHAGGDSVGFKFDQPPASVKDHVEAETGSKSTMRCAAASQAAPKKSLGPSANGDDEGVWSDQLLPSVTKTWPSSGVKMVAVPWLVSNDICA